VPPAFGLPFFLVNLSGRSNSYRILNISLAPLPFNLFVESLVLTMLASPKVGLLGGGQLGRMLMESANRLNIQMNVLDAVNSPAKQISAHDDHVTGSFTDRASLRKLAKTCDILTTEIEHVDTYALEEVASEIKVEPSWKTIRIIQDKFQQKDYLSQSQIPMAEYRELRENSVDELAAIAEELGYPLMLKSKTQAYDGRGKILKTRIARTSC
jgi:phosphoribosylaminoimidazole carboxylase